MPFNSFDAEGHSYDYQIPNEITEEIIEYLQGDNETLKSLSLSSRIFLHRARKHLFATLVLQLPDIVEKGTLSSLPSHKTFGLIKSAPHLIPYIQVLEIAGSQKTPRLKFDNEFSKALGLLQQTLETEIATSSLRHLCLHHIMWSDLSIDLQAAIQRLLGFRSLNMVTFYHTYHVPWAVFREISSNVTTLTVKHASFPEVETNAWFEGVTGPPRDPTPALLIKESGIDGLRIEALYLAHRTLGNDPTIIAHNPIFPLNLTHLRTYWVDVEWWIRHQEFISHVGRSLETLGINFSTSSHITLPSLNCCQLHNLKHLHVHTNDNLGRLALQSAFLWLCKSLETLPRLHQLQSIVIRCVMGVNECFYYQLERGFWPEVKKGLGWEHIDMFLTQPKFDSLPQIRVGLERGSAVKEPDYNAILRSAPLLLPRMVAKGIVVLDSCKEEPPASPFNNRFLNIASSVVRF